MGDGPTTEEEGESLVLVSSISSNLLIQRTKRCNETALLIGTTRAVYGFRHRSFVARWRSMMNAALFCFRQI
jgi:hypothetical protein